MCAIMSLSLPFSFLACFTCKEAVNCKFCCPVYFPQPNILHGNAGIKNIASFLTFPFLKTLGRPWQINRSSKEFPIWFVHSGCMLPTQMSLYADCIQCSSELIYLPQISSPLFSVGSSRPHPCQYVDAFRWEAIPCHACEVGCKRMRKPCPLKLALPSAWPWACCCDCNHDCDCDYDHGRSGLECLKQRHVCNWKE